MLQKTSKSKIGHNFSQLQQGLILTLQDKPVLLNDSVNQQSDILQNYQKKLINKSQHNRQLKSKIKILSNPATSHLQSKYQGRKNLLPHYDNYQYKSQQIDLQDNTILKKNNININKNISNDFQPTQNVKTDYYSSTNPKFISRKKTKHATSDLLSYLNETAIQKQFSNQTKNINAQDIIQQSLGTVRKRIKLQNTLSSISQNPLPQQDEYLLQKALKIKTKKINQQLNLLSIIKQQNQQNNNQQQQNPPKYTQIQLNPVTYHTPSTQTSSKKIYNITDTINGTTSCLYVNLPSEKITKQKQQPTLPSTFKQITPQQLQKMKQQLQFMEEKSMTVGLTGTLSFLRDNNLLNKQQQFGRTNDKQSHHNQPGDRIKLQYRNASGKLMKPKQAFRYQSAIFHGQGPGKKKIEKIKKNQLIQMKIKQSAAAPSKIMTLLQKYQQKNNLPHMILKFGANNHDHL